MGSLIKSVIAHHCHCQRFYG